MFDKELLKIANCKVIKIEKGSKGSLLIDSEPIIKADTNGTLAHEICHLLAGEKDYNLYNDAIWEKEYDKVFTYVLNTLFDWYHEYVYGRANSVVWKYLTEMHDNKETDKHFVNINVIDSITSMYLKRNIDPEYVGITEAADLVEYADQLCKELEKNRLYKKV